jgi:hypothetical protein
VARPALVPVNIIMTRNRIVKRLLTAAFVAALLIPGSVAAQDMMGEELPPEFVEALQKDVAELRMDAMQSTIQLSAGESATFWAIYEEYLAELNATTEGRAELLRDYVVQFETFTDDQVIAMGNRAIEQRMDQLALVNRYFDRIAREVSGITAGQFFQIENQVQMLIDLRLAMEIPIIGRR